MTFSIKWTFPSSFPDLTCIGLIVSVALIRVLVSFFSNDIRVKWPNDIIFDNKKLAGILIEGKKGADGSFVAIIGIGINFKLSNSIKMELDNKVTDLYEITGQVLDRNFIFGLVLQELVKVLRKFEQSGFASFQNEWIEYHAYQGKFVRLILPGDMEVQGVVRGINHDGSIYLETSNGYESFNIGEISLRYSE